MRSLPITAPPDPHAPRAGDATDTALADLRDDDLAALLTEFYDAVGRDPLLAPYFTPLDMAAHLPRIADFWSTLLFHSRRYQGNAFRPHLHMPGLTGDHFARWLATLERTVDARHAGPVAEQMKAVGHRIAYSMQLRLGITPFEPYRAD
jgi:hemoglobin